MSVMKSVSELNEAKWVGTDYEGVPVITHKFSLKELGDA
jgi:hypothetical protein